MRYFKVLINRKRAGHWTAFELETSKPTFNICYNRNAQYKQWFCYLTVFPFYLSKNNCVMLFGVYLIFIKIGFRVHGSFYKGVRRKKELKKLNFRLGL